MKMKTMQIPKILILFSFFTVFSCKDITIDSTQSKTVYTSPLGKEYFANEPSQKAKDEYEKARLVFEKDSNSVENTIWLGRRTAYIGNYNDAILIFTKAIERFPDDARIYRHRGHRYISIREFDKAIVDLEKAADLIRSKSDEIEPDGMPNAMNIPISTLHTNIYYHLGLAYYLKLDFEKAYEAYLKCYNAGTNDDNIVSSVHWLYMIQKRLGHNDLATEALSSISDTLKIIENHEYYKICKFYKGMLPIDSLSNWKNETPASDALKYGLANWYFYNEQKEKSKEIILNILNGNSWTSFGYIAAEVDYLKYISVK